MRPRHTGSLLLLALAAQIVLKLWLVHHHEIRTCDYPADDPWYVAASTNRYWWGSYVEGAFTRPPAYPLWIALSRNAGLPLRLSTELLFMAGAVAFVLSLVRAGLPRTLAALSLGVIVFHPLSIYVNDSVMSESLYAPLLLASLAGMVELVVQPGRRRMAVLTGLGLVVLWRTREETVLIVLQIGIFALVAAWTQAGNNKKVRVVMREVATTALIMSAVAAGIVLAVRTMNYVSFGVFADRQLKMPGFVAAHHALLRIAPERRLRWSRPPTAPLRICIHARWWC